MALAAASAACAAACLACLVALHVLPTGYSPVRNAVSEYGVGRFALLYRAQAALLGAAGIFLALALRNGVAAVSAQVLVELVAFGLARVAIGWYPTDLIGSTRRTRTGAIHVLLAVIAFSMITLAALRLGRELNHVAGWSTVADVVRGLALTMAVTALGTGIAVRTTPLRPWTGLIERGFYAAALAFFFVVTIKLATS
jgi:Protein of unknown function (DUF998)